MTDLFHQGPPEMAEDVRQLLLDIDGDVAESGASTPDCRPPIDVFKTGDALEILVDIPGVPAATLRVGVRRNTVVIVGGKPAGPIDSGARFHLAERSSGRFVRAVHLEGAFDPTRASALIGAGELRIVLPLIEDRRGRSTMVPVGPA